MVPASVTSSVGVVRRSASVMFLSFQGHRALVIIVAVGDFALIVKP